MGTSPQNMRAMSFSSNETVRTRGRSAWHRTQSTSSPGDMRLRQQRQYRGKKKSKRAWRYSERLCKILFFHMQATRNGIHFKSAAEAEANEFPVALIVGSSLHAPGFALQKLTEDT